VLSTRNSYYQYSVKFVMNATITFASGVGYGKYYWYNNYWRFQQYKFVTDHWIPDTTIPSRAITQCPHTAFSIIEDTTIDYMSSKETD